MKHIAYGLLILALMTGIGRSEKPDLTYSDRFQLLEHGIPVLDHTQYGEGGIVIRGKFGEVPYQRLVLWSRKLTPSNLHEAELAHKYFHHEAVELRVVSIFAVARFCGITKESLPGGVSFSNALAPANSMKFSAFLEFVEQQLRKKSKLNPGKEQQGETGTRSNPPEIPIR